MKKTDNEEEEIFLSEAAASIGLTYPVRISAELFETLKPNEFLTGLGIQYSDRIRAILGILKANLIPEDSKESIPLNGIAIPIPIARGPYIREELISIKADLTEKDGKEEILLTVVLETE